MSSEFQGASPRTPNAGRDRLQLLLQSRILLLTLVGKSFTCDDGSGTFDVVIYVAVRPEAPRNNFRWLITHGTGQYEGLLGSGTGFEDSAGDELDHYLGRVC